MPQTRTAVRAIGWLSIGMGIGALVAPGIAATFLGYRRRRWLARLLGVRDLVVGAGLLAATDTAPWLRARLAAEVADTALHAGGGLTGVFGRKRALLAAAASAGFGAVDRGVLARLG